MKTMIVPGALLPNLQAVCNGIREADPLALLPWAWDVGDSLHEVAPAQPPTAHFFRGIANLIRSAEKGVAIPMNHSKEKLIRGLTELGDYRWHQALLSAVVRGKGWAREIPEEDRFIREATDEAALRVTLFPTKSTIGLMREILAGKRKEVRVVPIRLGSGIQMAMAREFLRKLRPNEGVSLAKRFDKVAARLRETGAAFYPLEFGAEPGSLYLWERLTENPDLAHLDFAELSVLFKVVSFGWFSKNLISRIGNHSKGADLCRYALQHRFAFCEAISFCLEEQDPFPRANKIKDRMEAFRTGERAITEFSDLEEADKIALYALTVPLLNIGVRGEQPPVYDIFLRDVEIYLSFGDGNAAEMIKPFSDFMRLSGTEYGRDVETSIYDSFSTLFREVRGRWEFEHFLKKLHAALADINHPLPPHTLTLITRSLTDYKFPQTLGERIGSLLVLYRANLEIPPFVTSQILHSLFAIPSPLQITKKFIQQVQNYRQILSATPCWKELSDVEKCAFYTVISDHFYRKKEWGNYIPYPSFEDFSSFAVLLGQGISLEKFAGDIAAIQLGLGHDTPLTQMTQNPPIKDWLEVPKKISRFRKGLLRGNSLLNRTFVKNCKGVRDDIFEAALELFERGYALEGELFMNYAVAPDRLKLLSAAESEVEKLAQGKPTGSLEDPFAVLAMLHLLNDQKYPVFGSEGLLKMFGEMKTVPLHESVQLISLEFTAMSQKLPVLEILDKKIIQNFCEEIARHFSLPVAVGDIFSTSLNEGSVPRSVLSAVLEHLKVSSVEEAILAVKDLNEMEIEDVSKMILKTMAREKIWNSKTVKRLLMAFTAENYLGTAEEILIKSFNREETSPGELFLTLDIIWNFFEVEFAETVEEFRRMILKEPLDAEAKAKVEEIFHGKNFVAKERKRLKNIYGTLKQLDLKEENVTLLPSRDKVDAFFGHVGGNCLAAKSEYGLFGFTDPTFVPFRILINGKWMGTLMSFTRFIGDKRQKALILSGIDPQIPFKPDQFLDRLEENFAELARRGNYDLVLLTTGRGTISSRRAFLQAEAEARYRQKKFMLVSRIPLVKRGPEDQPKKNYYGFHDEFFILVDRRNHRR